MRNKNEKVTSTIDYPKDYRGNNKGEIANDNRRKLPKSWELATSLVK